MRSLTVFILWLFGSASAVGVAWTGIGVLDDDLVDPAPAVLGETETALLESNSVAADTGDDSGAVSSTRSTLDIGTSAELSTSTTVTDDDDGSTSTTSTGSTAPTSSTMDDSTTSTTNGSTASTSESTTTSTSPSSTSTSSASTSSTSGSSTGGQAQTKTFNLVGGVTAISFASSGTEVLWATPNPGFEVRIEPEAPGIKVEFRADHHRSRIDAWWANGPRYDIREEPDQ